MNEEKGLNAFEKFAKKELERVGWKPKKIRPTKANDNIGYPDFECSEDRHVEVKSGRLNNQFKAWAKLVKQGKSVFLMNIYKTGNSLNYSLHEIEFYIDEERPPEKEKLTCRVCKAKVDWLYHGDLCEECNKKCEVNNSSLNFW